MPEKTQKAKNLEYTIDDAAMNVVGGDAFRGCMDVEIKSLSDTLSKKKDVSLFLILPKNFGLKDEIICLPKCNTLMEWACSLSEI